MTRQLRTIAAFQELSLIPGTYMEPTTVVIQVPGDLCPLLDGT